MHGTCIDDFFLRNPPVNNAIDYILRWIFYLNMKRWKRNAQKRALTYFRIVKKAIFNKILKNNKHDHKIQSVYNKCAQKKIYVITEERAAYFVHDGCCCFGLM